MNIRHALRAILGACLLACATAAPACPAGEADAKTTQAIRGVLEQTWRSETTPLAVGPVVVVGEHAIADWQQGARGGRALMAKGTDGWQVTLCSGDGLRDARFLEQAGIDAHAAEALAAALATAESSLDSGTLARLASFDGIVRHAPGNSHAVPAHARPESHRH